MRVILLLCIAANLFGQAQPDHSSYLFPNGRTQFRNYLAATFGPEGFLRATIGAGIDESKPAPPEWDRGIQGLGERYGFRYGMVLISSTTEFSIAAVMHQDLTYYKCECHGFLQRTFHAMVSSLTARTSTGATVPSIPALAGAYGGSFAAVNAWYPARYGPADAFRIGSTHFLSSAGGNLVREFLLPRH